jgi:DNA-directed RNA polymerase specialized sigma24 family protein
MRAETEAGAGADGAVPPADEFTALYDRHFTDIYRYIAGRLGRDVADDIAADTFVVALRRWHTFDAARGGVRPWLFGIATRLVAQHRRQEVRRYRALARIGPEEITDSHENRVVTWVAAERDVLLLSALCKLRAVRSPRRSASRTARSARGSAAPAERCARR